MLLNQLTLLYVALMAANINGSIQGDDKTTTFNITVPGLRPPQEDYYVCTGIKAPEADSFIVSYGALASGNTAHHIILYSCSVPYSHNIYWNGGEACAKDTQILFAWAKNAPPTQLPDDVGFHIGGNSTAKYLVINVHYARTLQDDEPEDYSGLTITISTVSPKYLHGIFLFASGHGQIPPGQEATSLDVSCKYRGNKDLHAFAFRTHAHDLSRVISAYKKNTSVEGGWELLGKGNPQWPQAFYPMDSPHVIRKDDILVARCVYNSMNSNHMVRIGSSHTAEMCNFYMMYYAEGEAEFIECLDDQLPTESRQIPADSLVTLAPNANLDAAAHRKPFTGALDDEPSRSEFLPVIVAILLMIPVVSVLCIVTFNRTRNKRTNGLIRKYTRADNSSAITAPLIPSDKNSETDSDL